ncbi:hypothetical protein Pres01_23830 [Metapseudomonas resinovorans]|nr:hypothetical protein Pres01_23830 [Pseudomonas resinovorans]
MHTSRNPIIREMASMPDGPVILMIRSEARKLPQSISAVERKINGGAVIIIQGGKLVLCLRVAEALMISAMVPGPVVLGMASGMNAKLARFASPLRDAEGGAG